MSQEEPITCAGGAINSTLGLQPGDGGANPTSALHSRFHIRPVDHRTAKAHVKQWHYSRLLPKGKNIPFGLYDGAELYAVIVYGIGVNPYQARFLGVNRVLEIKRMCRTEPRRPYPLSRLIAITLRFVRKDHQPECVVAFADPEEGHEGTVYAAAGFQRHGLTNAEWHVVDKDGVKRHRRYAYRYAKRNGCTIAAAREQLGLTRSQTQPKIRWIKRLAAPATAVRQEVAA